MLDFRNSKSNGRVIHPERYLRGAIHSVARLLTGALVVKIMIESGDVSSSMLLDGWPLGVADGVVGRGFGVLWSDVVVAGGAALAPNPQLTAIRDLIMLLVPAAALPVLLRHGHAGNG